MNNSLKLIIKRQLLFIGGSLALYFVVSYYFGFLLGLVANTALFIGILFYLRRKQIMEQRSLGSDGKAYSTGLNWFSDNSTKMRYICISCGSEMKGIVECNKCGSKMKKPIF
ncbi:MAG: hypothetical protein WAL66_12110 [Nitrososphaeraceae archaeon]|jgi:hypothetical protein